MPDASVAETPSRPSWVGEALDAGGSWSLRAKAPWLIGLLMLFDSWDSTVIAYVLPVLRQQWSLDAVQAGGVLSAGYGGQFFGALIFGGGSRALRAPAGGAVARAGHERAGDCLCAGGQL